MIGCKSMSRAAVAAAVLMSVVFVLSGCGGGSSTVSFAPQSSTVVLGSGLTLTLTDNTSSAPLEGSVVYDYTIANRTLSPITVDYGYDILAQPPIIVNLIVKDSTGLTIATNGGSSPPPPPPPTAQNVTIQPGQTMSGSQTYTFVRADHYTATASLYRSDGSATTAAGPLTVRVQ